ncbi:MAG: hypothetical protein H6700_06930 [Myxococcales bacterium]|nr:hypothetical protein [Myxococcales bacterium]
MTSNPDTRASVSVLLDENSVTVSVPAAVYGREAVMGAAYVFIDRAYVLVDAPADGHHTVRLRGRSPLDSDGLAGLGGELGNELLAQQLRHLVCERNRHVLEGVVGGAVSGAAGPEPAEEFDLSALESMEFDDEAFEDPLGIAMSWEDKYGNKRASKKEAADMKEAAESASKEDA